MQQKSHSGDTGAVDRSDHLIWIANLQWRAMCGLGRYGSWREVTDQLQKDTIGVERMDNAPGIGISTRAARCDLREKGHILRFENGHRALDVRYRKSEAIDALVIDRRRISGLRVEGRYPLKQPQAMTVAAIESDIGAAIGNWLIEAPRSGLLCRERLLVALALARAIGTHRRTGLTAQ